MKILLKGIFLISLFLFGGCTYSCEANKCADQTQQQKETNSLRKLSPELYEAYIHNKNSNKKVTILVKTVAPLTDEQVKELKKESINIETVAGNICTAELSLKAIPFLVERTYVRHVELSKKLHLLHH